MFILFCGENYYPRGGWSDFYGRYETLEDALVAAANAIYDWWQIVSLETQKIVREGQVR